MEYIKLGKSGLKASRIGFGCSRIASLSTAYTPSEVRQTLLSAFSNGINFFDTADIYGQGDSERLLGRIFNKKREQLIFCTKAGLTLSMSQNLVRFVKPPLNFFLRRWKRAQKKTISLRKEKERQNFEPDYLKRRIQSSLRRLKTDYIDLFLLHSPPVEFINIDAVFEMLIRQKERGFIHSIGISCDNQEQAFAAISIPEVDCIQIPVNPMEMEIIQRVLPAAKKKGIGIIAREPFGGGSLFKSNSFLEMNKKLPTRTMQQTALKFSMQQDDSSVVLTGMASSKHLNDNLESLLLPDLSEEVIMQLKQNGSIG